MEILKAISGHRRVLLLVMAAMVLLNLAYLLGVDWLAIGPGVGMWKFASDRARYYIVDEEFVNSKSELRKVAQFLEDVPIGKEELTRALTEKLDKEGGDLLKKIYADVSEKYTEEYKTILQSELKKQMEQDYTYLFFQTIQKSYTLLRELKARYLELHEKELRDALATDFLKDTTDVNLQKKLKEGTPLRFDRQKYFLFLFNDVLLKYQPRIAKLTKNEIGRSIMGNAFHEIIDPPYSKRFLTKHRVTLKKDQFEELQKNHDHVVRELRSIPQPPDDLYNGDGIAISANKLHLPGALMLAAQLRQFGSQLPIEIVLDSEADYNKQACEEIAPKLDAKCIVTERILGSSLFDLLGKEPFQLKAIALLMSSFDHTIALDADNYATKNIDQLLTSWPYLETRFILWPDIWHKGTSPLYYDIARFEIGDVVKRQGLDNSRPFLEYSTRDYDKEIYFHDFEGTPPGRGVESGQLVFSKREHFRSLALAAYYNIHKDFYYPLLYQGVHGSGDRETFVPALHVMKEPYYFCDYQNEFLGVNRQRVSKPEETFFDESTMVQRDPQQSEALARKWRQFLRSQSLDTRLYMFQQNEYTKDLYNKFRAENEDFEGPDVLFLHIHLPKMNPLFNELTTKNSYDYESRYIRKIGEFNDKVGTFDHELRIHAISQWLVCDQFTDDNFWKSFEVDRKALCSKITKYVKTLKKDSNDPSAADLKELHGKIVLNNK